MLYVVGVGPGDPSLITLRGLEAIRRCEVVAGWRSVLERFRQFIEGKEVVVLSYSNQDVELERLAAESTRRDVAILVHGDPTVSEWELMARIKAAANRSGAEIEVVPGVSSVSVALARLGLDLAHVIFASLHARNPDIDDLIKAASTGRTLVVFPYPSPQRLAEILVGAGCEGRATVLERLTMSGERVTRFTSLAELARSGETFSDLAIVVVEDVKCRHGWARSTG